MTEEIKEILNNFIEIVKKPTYTKEAYDGNLITLYKTYTLKILEIKTLLEYITNLQKEKEIIENDFKNVSEKYFFEKQRNEKAVDLLKRIQEKYGYMLEDVIFLLLQGGDE